MNLLRIWILRLAAAAALLFAASLLYNAYQDLAWTRLAIAEAGPSAYSGRVAEEILGQSAEKERNGTVEEGAGLVLAASALMMEALATALKRLASLKVEVPQT
jgi:hypothetical protein